jgi:hypothetical protein
MLTGASYSQGLLIAREGSPFAGNGEEPRYLTLLSYETNLATMSKVRTIAKMAAQIIPLQEIERLSSSVIRILGGNPGKAS